MTTLTRTSLSFTLAALIGCTHDLDAPTIEPGNDDQPDVATEVEPALVALTTDRCDESVFSGAAWQTMASPHFTLSYLPDTAAEQDRDAIAARLESAYTAIRGELGITAEPSITINLSPSRVAAAAHNKSFGRSWPDLNRYDVVYTGADDSFEVQRYGMLLTQVLNWHLDTTNRIRLPFLTAGVAEYLDQSPVAKHAAYAQQLLAASQTQQPSYVPSLSADNPGAMAELGTKDVSGRNAARAGSFVQFAVERYGMDQFVDIFRATSGIWTNGCYTVPSYGCIGTPEQLTGMLDGVLTATVGESWSEVQPLWQAQIQTAWAQAPDIATTTTRDITNVLRVMDRSIETKDAAMYRSTLEGFYCDYGGDSLRAEISDRAVSALSAKSSKLLAVVDTGIKNFSTAQALVQRTDAAGVSTVEILHFERLSVGWRVTWGPDWQ